jgi:hypothetical protein
MIIFSYSITDDVLCVMLCHWVSGLQHFTGTTVC